MPARIPFIKSKSHELAGNINASILAKWTYPNVYYAKTTFNKYQ